MADSLRIVLISHSADGFAVVHDACTEAGHTPVAYVHARSPRPNRPAGPRSGETVAEIVKAVPTGVDLLLPANGEGLSRALPGYRADLIVCSGFPWRIPRKALDVPRIGAVNIHPSLLPRYRGPVPIHWAIRNGDPETGVTIHWMDEDFDTGRIIAQRGGIPIEDDLDPELLLRRLDTLTRELLVTALERVLAGDPGREQDEAAAWYGGWMEEGFSYVDRSHTVRQIHNQVRTFRFGVPGPPGPLVQVDGTWIAVLRTRPDPAGGGLRMQCADGPLWIVEYEPADPPQDR